MLQVLIKSAYLFNKIADKMQDHIKQIKDPRQLNIKFLKNEKLDFELFTFASIPINKLKWLSKHMHANGSMKGLFKDSIYSREHNTDQKELTETNLLLAKLKNKIIGAMIIDNHNYINIYVDPIYRGEGFGTKMIEFAKNKFGELHYGPSPIGRYFFRKTIENEPVREIARDYKPSNYDTNEEQNSQINQDIYTKPLFDDKEYWEEQLQDYFTYFKPISDYVIENNIDFIKWEAISAKPWFTEDLIKKYAKYVDWKRVSLRTDLSKQFLKDFKHKLDWQKIKYIYKYIYPELFK